MFQKRNGSMVDSQFLLSNLLVSCFFASSLCDVISIDLKPGSESLSGASVSLICTLDRYTGPISIYKSDDKTEVGSALSKCDQAKCRNLIQAYSFTITGNTVEIRIKSLQRAEDQKWWTCSTPLSETKESQKQFHLTVHTLPASIKLEEEIGPCDLGQNNCEYTCTTNQCTYPSPSFTWLYVLDDDITEVISHPTSMIMKGVGCTDETKIYESTLKFLHYERFNGNTPKTVRLQCRITFTALPSGTRTSGVSQNITFAVKVSTVQISDGNTELTGNTLTVIDKERKLLKCIPGKGNPTPTVEWFIGRSTASTKEEFSFIPDNSYHGKEIYCVADNIPNDDPDAVSIKPVLYIKVKIQFVYIEPAADTDILVIENTQEPAVCTTSAGRPGSSIKWYKNNIELDEGASIDFERTSNNLNVTKSTRYINVSRSESGWTLSCKASNFEGSSPIWANNSKQLNVLYPPENMSILINGKPVVGPAINLIEGTPATLKCTASSNPLASAFSWNINQANSDTLTIDDSIQNGQTVNCTAKNSMTSSASTNMNGYGSISKTINLQYGARIQRIVINGVTNSSLVIKEGDPILVDCYVDSNPRSTISLFQGGNLLMEKQQNAVLTYNISSAQCNHTSPYTCKAENGIVNVEQPAMKTVQINVKCSPRLAFNTEPTVIAQENTPAVLSLSILAYPIPVEYDWHKNSSNTWEKLNNSTSIQMTQLSLQFNLTFISVKPEDYGEYKLTVYYINDLPFNFTGVLKADEEPEPLGTDDESTAFAGIIGGVVGGLLSVCLIVILICILRRRKSFDDVKTKLFGKKSTALTEEIQPQDTGYSYTAVEKPKGESALDSIDSANAESTGGKNEAKKTKAAPETANEGPCYVNPAVLFESESKTKPQKKGKPAKQKDKKQISQSHDGLQYVELSFSDTKKKSKKTKPVQPKADERTVYDAVQFGVVGAAYTSNGEEND